MVKARPLGLTPLIAAMFGATPAAHGEWPFRGGVFRDREMLLAQCPRGGGAAGGEGGSGQDQGDLSEVGTETVLWIVVRQEPLE